MTTRARFLMLQIAVALIAVAGFAAVAAAAPEPKTDICHIPPGNPENFHTISISLNALEAHLAHGDLGGACNAMCATLCDDGNACTIDDTGNCETDGCPPFPRAPVDCNDNDVCTADSCDEATGCNNVEAVCTAPDLCTTNTCAPDTGECVESPKVCPDGFVCSLETGECEEETGPDPECAGQTCGTFTTCNAGGSCGTNGVCGSTAEGGGLCVNGSTSCADLADCPGGSGDCADGDICIVDSCCGTPVCAPNSLFCSESLADGSAEFTSEATISTESGPTIGSE